MKTIARLLTLCLLSTIAAAGDQPQWGQRHTRNMVSDETGLPESFDPETGHNVKWVVPLGSQTYATPIVAGGKVLIGTNNDPPRDARNTGDRGILLCLNEADGSFCWQLAVPNSARIATSIGRRPACLPQQRWRGIGSTSSPTVSRSCAWI